MLINHALGTVERRLDNGIKLDHCIRKLRHKAAIRSTTAVQNINVRNTIVILIGYKLAGSHRLAYRDHVLSTENRAQVILYGYFA